MRIQLYLSPGAFRRLLCGVGARPAKDHLTTALSTTGGVELCLCGFCLTRATPLPEPTLEPEEEQIRRGAGVEARFFLRAFC